MLYFLNLIVEGILKLIIWNCKRNMTKIFYLVHIRALTSLFCIKIRRKQFKQISVFTLTILRKLFCCTLKMFPRKFCLCISRCCTHDLRRKMLEIKPIPSVHVSRKFQGHTLNTEYSERDLFLVKSTDALIFQIYFVKKIYMFRAVPLPETCRVS